MMLSLWVNNMLILECGENLQFEQKQYSKFT